MGKELYLLHISSPKEWLEKDISLLHVLQRLLHGHLSEIAERAQATATHVGGYPCWSSNWERSGGFSVFPLWRKQAKEVKIGAMRYLCSVTSCHALSSVLRVSSLSEQDYLG